MNNESNIPARPALSIYHPNGKCSGFALRLSMEPATFERDGALFLSLARQQTVADPAAGRWAAFDWADAIKVRFGFVEVAEILMVFGGQASVLTHAGKDGLFHVAPAATVSVQLKRAEDPMRPGFLLGVGRTPKADPNARQYFTFVFSPAEAFALRAAISAKLGDMAFGS